MKKIIWLTLAMILLAAALVNAEHSGCCCTPIDLTGIFTADHTSCDVTQVFAEIPAGTVAPDCNDICEAELAPPIDVPPDIIPADCNSPLFKPAPTGLIVTPVKGKKHLKLTWDVVLCPAYSVTISRCEGTDCNDFSEIATISPVTFYTDSDPNLRWNTDYTYQIVANYIISDTSEPTTAVGNAGDIECWSQGDNTFCVSQFYYGRFIDYLQTFGYKGTSAIDFSLNFDAQVSFTFSDRINRAWKCDGLNNLYRETGMAECSVGTQCVADDSGTDCITPSPCDQGGIFGLFSNSADCESQEYCFFDRSHGSVNKCYDCDPRMSCADYRSADVCGRDPCRAGQCEWRDVFDDIGIGVCVDTRLPNCQWCRTPGTLGVSNEAAYNEVFDQCNVKKAAALSIEPEYPCTYNINAQEANACDTTACMDYSIDKCTNPPGIEIFLNNDNSLETISNDLCGINVCEVMEGIGCAKNHAGSSIPDCDEFSTDRRQCELDYFPPETSLVPRAHVLGRMDWLDVRMMDKLNATSDHVLMAGNPNYGLYLCVVGAETSCNDATSGEFVFSGLTELNFNDLNLQSGQDIVGTMTVGPNTLRYYSVDNRYNPEVVKEMNIIACDLCQGPKIIDVSVTPGKEVNDVFYTISDLPLIKITFNELASLTSAVLMKGDTAIPVTPSPSSGMNYEYSFIPLSTLDDDTYIFTFNAKDVNGLLMDFEGAVEIVVDTTPGNVQIIPSDGSILESTFVDIQFIFDEQITLHEAVLEEEIWVNQYTVRKNIINLTDVLQISADDLTYSTSLTLSSGGKKNLRVVAEDFAGNPTIGRSSFWINQGQLRMRMRKPTWGVSPVYKFDVVIDSTRDSECKYIFGIPVPPPTNSFEVMNSFDDTTGVTHTVFGFDKISPGDLKSHNLHVYCKLDQEIEVETFNLSVDPTIPNILSAFAQPKVIVERRVPGQDIFTTSLKVQTDDLGFCKYDREDVPFVLMEGLFSEFDEVPKKSHDAEINVTQDKTEYTYYVACKNTAEMPSATKEIKFSVDLSVPFGVDSTTPAYSNSTQFAVSVEANKRSFCFIGTHPDAVLTPMGGYVYGYAHTHPVEVDELGNHTWYIKCSTGATSEVASEEITVVVDNTPPVMKYVDDSSNLVEEPEFSYFLNQLMVKFFAEENESRVNAYYYRVTTFLTDTVVMDWNVSTNLDGTSFFVTGLDLVDGNKYKFEVYPVNVVGLKGEVMTSDGVMIDVTKEPEACQNLILDAEESDIDCGGQCIGCLDGANCNVNTDCQSGLCDAGVCVVSGCDDGIKNNEETDVDCGGSICLPCSDGKTCVENTDCTTNNCNFGVCSNEGGCNDGILTGTETDVDCGGSCQTKCGQGQNCQTIIDCAEGLQCIDSTCLSEQDSDGDGVSDDIDQCPNTPTNEVADATGCSPSQRFSCGDEISDGWRMRYFDTVLCDGEGAPSADPDEDGLTNAEEYRHGTDPTNPDSDFDGWNDKVEVDKGYNPNDPTSHPPSKLRIFLWILLILIVLFALGVAGYVGYKYYLERSGEEQYEKQYAPKPTVKKQKPWPSVIEKLRSIARKEEPPITGRDWLSLTALEERLKKDKVHVKKDVFDKLKSLVHGKISREEAPSVLAALEKDPKAFKLLRKITVEKLSEHEKEFVKKRLALLKAGRISSSELEELLHKLRIIAAYYRIHKKDLEKELDEWLVKKK